MSNTKINSTSESNPHIDITSNWYKAIVQNSPDGFLLMEYPGGDILDTNDAFCNMTGYSYDELLSMNMKDIDIEFAASSDEINKRLLIPGNSRGVFIETLHQCKDGKIINVSFSFSSLDDNTVFCFYRDITKQKNEFKQELKRHKNKERKIKKQISTLQNLLDTIPAGIYLLDQEARIVYTNKAGEKSLDTPREQVIGKTAYEAQPKRAESFSAFQADIKVLETGHPSRSIFTNQKPVGLRWFQLVRYPYYDNNKRVVGVANVELEITDRIQIENRLKKLLEQEKVLRDRLETQNQQNVEFTRALVHELKTPLTAIISSSELLSEELGSASPSGRLAVNIINSACSLNKRIGELLDVAKGEIGMLRIIHEPLDPRTLLLEIADEMTPAVIKAGQTIEIEHSRDIAAHNWRQREAKRSNFKFNK